MSLIKKFTPQNSDQFVGKDQGDHTLAKFGHLNYILRNITIQIGNVTLPAGYVLGPGPGANVTNTAFGYQAFDSNVSGLNNTALGWNALTASTVTNNNVAIGYNALAAHTAAGNGNSVAIGYNALSTKTGLSDSNNVAIGVLAMSDSGGTGGQSNTAVGGQALRNNNGNRNVSVGYQSMRFNTTGANNVTIGYQGLYNTTGTQNIGIGYLSGYLITTGSYNVVIGGNSGSSINTLSNFMLFADGQGNERFRVPNTGNFLLGSTVDNGSKFQVTGTQTVNGAPTINDYTKSVVTITNTNASQNTYGLVTLDTNVVNSPADIRLGTNPTSLRIYATNLPAAVATGAAIQMFRNTDPSFPGQVFFDSGSNNSSALIFRTAPASTTLTERMRVKTNGSVRFTPMAQPATAEAGDVYYDSGTNKLRCYNGTIWNDLF